MTSPAELPNGVQTPRLQCVPLSNGSVGQEAVELAASAGLFLDPWQAYVLENTLGLRADGRWAARDVGLVVSRQNGKGSILEARELAGLFLLGEMELVHTAHLFKTSVDHFLRIRTLIANTPDLMGQVKHRGIRIGNGDEAITLKSGARLRFVARSVNGSGRGFAKIDFLALDEAYDIPESAAASLLPIQLASPNPQTWYVSSVEDRGDDTEVLRSIVDDGREGNTPTLAYFEWSAPEGSDPDDVDARAQANPGLGLRLSHDSLQSLRLRLKDKFSTEHLSIWPKRGAQADPLFGPGMWEAGAVEPAPGVPQVASGRCFGIAVTLDRSYGCISQAGFTDAGKLWVEPMTHAPGTEWIVAEALKIQAKWSAYCVIDKGGPAGVLIPALEAADVKLVIVDTAQVCDAFATLFDAVQLGDVQHWSFPELDAGVAGASKRTVGDRTTLGRKVSSADISPIESVMLAAWGSSTGQLLDYDIDKSVY